MLLVLSDTSTPLLFPEAEIEIKWVLMSFLIRYKVKRSSNQHQGHKRTLDNAYDPPRKSYQTCALVPQCLTRCPHAPRQPDSAATTTPRLSLRPDPPPRRLPALHHPNNSRGSDPDGWRRGAPPHSRRRRQGSPAASARRGARDPMQGNQRWDCWHHARHTLSTLRNSLLSGSPTPGRGVFSSATRTRLVMHEAARMSVFSFSLLAQHFIAGKIKTHCSESNGYCLHRPGVKCLSK